MVRCQVVGGRDPIGRRVIPSPQLTLMKHQVACNWANVLRGSREIGPGWSQLAFSGMALAKQCRGIGANILRRIAEKAVVAKAHGHKAGLLGWIGINACSAARARVVVFASPLGLPIGRVVGVGCAWF